MKVNLTVDVDDRQRYVIAKYYRSDVARAKRWQVRRFVMGAVESAVREQQAALSRRQRAVAARLGDLDQAPEPLREPDEKQLMLVFQGEA